MATNITVKSPNSESTIYEVSLFDDIEVKKGDYVFVSERPELLNLEIVNGSLKIKFPDKNSVLVKDIVNLITQNTSTDSFGLMDRLDNSAISFLDEKGAFKEIDSVDKLLVLVAKAENTNEELSTDIIEENDNNTSNTNITNENRPTIRGITESGATVTITDDDGKVLGSTIADVDGNYSITTSELPDGTQNLKITATDKAGNSGTEIQTITVNTSESDIKKLEITNITDANEEYSYITISGKGLESKNTVSIFDEDGIKIAATTILEDGTWNVGFSNFAGTPVSKKEFFKAVENDITGNEVAQIDSHEYWSEKLAVELDVETTDDIVIPDILDDEINMEQIPFPENNDDISEYEEIITSEELAIAESLEESIEEYENDVDNSLDEEEDIAYEDELDYIEDDILNEVQFDEKELEQETSTTDEIDLDVSLKETKEIITYPNGWEKSDIQIKDGEDIFEVWTKDDVTVYVDISTTLIDI